MAEVIGQGDIEGDFNCCSNADPLPFKCSNCGHIMVYCVESSDLFPNLHHLDEFVAINATDRTRPAFSCPRCGHVFEFFFPRNEAYRVTREELVERGLGHLLAGG